MRKLLLLVGAAALAFGVGTVAFNNAAAQDCQEDEACWNCETMGNKICGTLDVRAQQCADKLGIEWTREDGATERLDAFRRCMS